DSATQSASEAASACEAKGAHLVEIDSSHELQTVEAVATGAGLSGPFWVAGAYHVDSSSWDDTPTGCPVVFRWEPSQPMPVGGQLQSCVTHDPNSGARMIACSNAALA